MKNKGILITAIFLIISIGNYFRIIYNGSIRNVDFVSIFAIGALFGVLLTLIIKEIRDRKKQQ